jgi:hypothetical protein
VCNFTFHGPLLTPAKRIQLTKIRKVKSFDIDFCYINDKALEKYRNWKVKIAIRREVSLAAEL